MSRFLGDPKKASELLKRNEAVLDRSDGRSQLFGDTFYKALYKRAKGHKHSAEIKREFTAQHRSKSSQGQYRTNPGYPKKPFPGSSVHTPQFRSQRGAYQGSHQSRGRGQQSRGFNKPKSGYVYLFSNRTFNHTPDTGKNSPPSDSIKNDHVRLSRPGGGPISVFSKKLTNDPWILDTIKGIKIEVTSPPQQVLSLIHI